MIGYVLTLATWRILAELDATRRSIALQVGHWHAL